MLIVGIIFIILGILIKHGEMYFLIAGYNTMSKKKKAQYNIGEIATLMRNVMFAMAVLIITGYFLANWLDNPTLEILFMFIAIVLGLPYLLVKANSDKYKINSR